MKKITCIHNELFLSCKEQSDVVYQKKIQLENIVSELKHSQKDKYGALFHLWALNCFCWGIFITLQKIS